MEKQVKYTIVTVESYPYGWETKYFYMLKNQNMIIGDVITRNNGKQYKIIDGKTSLSFEDIDLSKYERFDSE